MRAQGHKIIFILILACLSASCQSRFAEPTPSLVEQTGISFEEREKRKVQLEQELAKVTAHLQKLANVLSLVRKTQDSSQSYTPIDFLLDVNKELSSSLPDRNAGLPTFRVSVELANKGLSGNCQYADLTLKLHDPSQTKTGEKNEGLEWMSYEVKTCFDDLPVKIAQVLRTANGFSLLLNNKSFGDILSATGQPPSIGDAKCSIAVRNWSALESLNCNNLGFEVANSEAFVIDGLTYNEVSSERLVVNTTIKKNGKAKATLLVVMRNGKLDSSLNVIPEETKPAAESTEDTKAAAEAKNTPASSSVSDKPGA